MRMSVQTRSHNKLLVNEMREHRGDEWLQLKGWITMKNFALNNGDNQKKIWEAGGIAEVVESMLLQEEGSATWTAAGRGE